MLDLEKLKKLCQQVRYDILTATTEAGSGHPTSSLSAVELMVTLFFGGFYHPDDRIIFSKGHASPLLYSLYHVLGKISQAELMTLRKMGSDLEGHPTFRFKYADVATGSLGQGLSAGIGISLGLKLSRPNPQSLIPNVYVLLGDSEMAEGQVWEAVQIASHYKLNNLVAITDINRLGQSRETMLGWDLETYKKRFEAFGWNVVVVEDGHDLEKIYNAFEKFAFASKPTIILAHTIKGKGVSFLENKEEWHGKVIPKEMLGLALKELGEITNDKL